MWTQENNVALRVRQSGASNSVWSVKCWSDGARMAVHSWFAPTRVFQQTLTGNDWGELRFKPWRRGRNNATPPDGMELEIQAAPGAPGFALDCGLMPPGVYALSLRLTASGGAVLGSVIREPFVVIRNRQPGMDGKNYRDGLELELEDQTYKEQMKPRRT